MGQPVKELVSTSYVERQNLTMRMGMRRFTRLTSGFSKKIENHLHMLSLYFAHYNFVRMHKTLKMTPAMAAGVTDTLHDTAWIVGLIDANAPAPKKRGPYKKKIIQTETLPASAMGWILAYLAFHPELQEQIGKEIFVTGTPAADLGHCDLLSSTVKEVLRLRPPAPKN